MTKQEAINNFVKKYNAIWEEVFEDDKGARSIYITFKFGDDKDYCTNGFVIEYFFSRKVFYLDTSGFEEMMPIDVYRNVANIIDKYYKKEWSDPNNLNIKVKEEPLE